MKEPDSNLGLSNCILDVIFSFYQSKQESNHDKTSLVPFVYQSVVMPEICNFPLIWVFFSLKKEFSSLRSFHAVEEFAVGIVTFMGLIDVIKIRK